MWEEEIDLYYCPKKYNINCKNYLVNCSRCRAGKEKNASLFYEPIKKIGPHPILDKESKERTKLKADQQREKKQQEIYKRGKEYNREGRKKEKEVIHKIGARLTACSGAILGDGDGILKVREEKFKLSHKTRFNNRNLLGPTAKEWEEEKVDIWLTTSKKDTVVTMSIDTLKNILEQINE